MDSSYNRENLFRWCSLDYKELENHPDRKIKVEINETKKITMSKIGDMMADELASHNEQGKITKWVLPAGPMDQFDRFIERVNKEHISCKNLYIFHMDEFLDWNCRPYPIGDTYESLEGTMNAGFYNRIKPELTVPLENRFWPRINDIDFCDKKAEELGGIDTLWAGVGAHGLIAFCDSPQSFTYHVSEHEYVNSLTRIVDISEESVIAMAQRTFGACYDRIPPKGITLGFKVMLSAKRAVLMITTGQWKNTVVRVALFSDPTLEYPVTLLSKYIPDVLLMTDVNTADHPMSAEIKGW